MEHPGAAACYREYQPCEALQPYVRAFFYFSPPAGEKSLRHPITREVVFKPSDCFCSPMFADGHGSIVCSLGKTCQAGQWRPDPRPPGGEVIGAVSSARATSPDERAEMVGVYFRATGLARFTAAPAAVLTDRIATLEDVWGNAGNELVSRLSETRGESARIECLESALLRRINESRTRRIPMDVAGLAAWVLRRNGQVTVESMAEAAGISRQHLTRVFRKHTGVTPKLYCRLARFQAALVCAGCGGVEWAQAAAELGYADQSHMIAEFREFSSLTPQMLASRRWFHPFIEQAWARSWIV